MNSLFNLILFKIVADVRTVKEEEVKNGLRERKQPGPRGHGVELVEEDAVPCEPSGQHRGKDQPLRRTGDEEVAATHDSGSIAALGQLQKHYEYPGGAQTVPR